MTAYVTNNVASKWNTATHFTPNGIPVAGDTITFGSASHDLEVPSGYSAIFGTGTAGSWDLDIIGTLTVNGDLECQGDVRQQTGSVVDFNAGSKLESGVIDATWQWGNANNGAITFRLNGTDMDSATNYVTLQGKTGRFIKFTSILAGAASPLETVKMHNVRATRVGNAANDALYIECNKAKSYDFKNVVWDDCGDRHYAGALDPAFLHKSESEMMINPADSRPIHFATNAVSVTMTASCYFRKFVLIGDGVSKPAFRLDKLLTNVGVKFEISDLILVDAQLFTRQSSGWDIDFAAQSFAASTQDMVLYRGNSEGGAIFHNSVFDTAHSNAHQFVGTNGGVTPTNPIILEDSVFFCRGGSTDNAILLGDGITIRNCIGVGGSFVTALSSAMLGDVDIYHNTHMGTAPHNKAELLTIETTEPTQHIDVQSNIDYRTTSSGYIARNGVGVPSDDVMNVGDYNVQSYSGGSEPACAYDSSITMAAKSCGDAGFGLNDINDNPNFVNEDYTIATWHDTLLGTGATEDTKIDNAFTEIIKYATGHDRSGTYVASPDSRYTKAALLSAIYAAAAPTNTALESNGHDGEDRGALSVVSTSGIPIFRRRLQLRKAA